MLHHVLIGLRTVTEFPFLPFLGATSHIASESPGNIAAVVAVTENDEIVINPEIARMDRQHPPNSCERVNASEEILCMHMRPYRTIYLGLHCLVKSHPLCLAPMYCSKG